MHHHKENMNRKISKKQVRSWRQKAVCSVRRARGTKMILCCPASQLKNWLFPFSNFFRWMLKAPPANPRDQNPWTFKISPREGR